MPCSFPFFGGTGFGIFVRYLRFIRCDSADPAFMTTDSLRVLVTNAASLAMGATAGRPLGE